MISSFRFGWIDYFKKENPLIKIIQFLFGILFLHSRQIAYYLFRLVPFSKEDKVLDLGCGDGSFSNWISFKTGARVLGIDRLEQRINDANKTSVRYKLQSKFIATELESIVFDNSSFSKVLLVDLIEHLKEPERLIKKVFDWLLPGGIIFISTPIDKQKRWFLKGDNDFFGYGEDKHEVRGFNPQILSNLLYKSGFTRVQVKIIFYSIYQIIWEIVEPVRKRRTNLYRFFAPILFLFLILDRVFKIGQGNGLLIVARK